ncbi:MAG: hypothetical protein FWE82_06975 [Defluviitaleaceae bacterium]|nr:hypothetical protein [Defluviitaleaceae bacterium]
MPDLFPRTTVAGVSLPRLIIGTNWFQGYSHKTPALDKLIVNHTRNADFIAQILAAFIERGVDAVLGVFNHMPEVAEAVKKAEDITGKKMILIDTPWFNVDDSNDARAEAKAVIQASKKAGADFCLPHHSTVEQLVCKNTATINRLPDYLTMIRDAGMIPGLSCHMPELVIYSDANGYDVETYIQLYNCLGYLMQVEIEFIHRVIWNAKKPVITIKPLAAGRLTPFVGFNFVWNTLRDCDMVTIGCMTKEEAEEDVEISLAAIERRMPGVEGRNSPRKTTIMAN